jgi:arsenate reductase
VRRDYFKERFTIEELRAVLADAGLTPHEVLSRRAKAYATLIGDRDLSDDELLALMVQEPTLLRRPLAVRGEQTAIGFDRVGLTALAESKS